MQAASHARVEVLPLIKEVGRLAPPRGEASRHCARGCGTGTCLASARAGVVSAHGPNAHTGRHAAHMPGGGCMTRAWGDWPMHAHRDAHPQNARCSLPAHGHRRGLLRPRNNYSENALSPPCVVAALGDGDLSCRGVLARMGTPTCLRTTPSCCGRLATIGGVADLHYLCCSLPCSFPTS
jgi:hypothetical protein